MTRPLRLVVLGMMGAYPFGGQAWLYLNWLRGLSRLGHDVWYVEDNGIWQYDPRTDTMTDGCEYGVAHVARALEPIGFGDRWAVRWPGPPERRWGPGASRLTELYATCDALLNLCGATALDGDQLAAECRVLIETDPVVDELRLASGDAEAARRFARHHVVATYGEAYGRPECEVPLPRNRLVHTRQPVDLDLWPDASHEPARAFTTIANYRVDVHDVEFNGVVYRWSKHDQWERFLDLPSRTAQPFSMALKIAAVDQARLEAHGWKVIPAMEMSLDVWGAYPAFIRASRGEFSVAKDPNVVLRSGWFSERDACYLASGRPVVAQDTGFRCAIPTGSGLFAVNDVDEAAAAIDAVNDDYPRHAAAARALAESHFEATAVAKRFLADVGL